MPTDSPHPDEFASLMIEGIKLAGADRHEEAVRNFEKAASLDPVQPEPHLFLGQSLNALERYDQAVRAFTKATELDPQNPDALIGRGYSFYLLESPERAIADLKKAAELNSEDPEAYIRLGDLYIDTARWSDALEAYDKALSFDANMEEARIGRALALGHLDRYAEAETALKNVAQDAADSADLQFNVGGVFLTLGRPDEAVAPLERALELEPGNTLATFGLARAYTESNRLAEAETLCRQVVEKQPDSVDAHYLLTLIYLGMGNGEAAAKELEELARMDPALANQLLMHLLDPESGQ